MLSLLPPLVFFLLWGGESQPAMQGVCLATLCSGIESPTVLTFCWPPQ